MRGKTRLFGVFGAAVLMCALLLTGALAAQGPEAGEATVLFTHDLHSCFFPRAQEGGGELGGFARLAAALEEEREDHPDALPDQHRRAVGEHRVPGDPQLLMYLPQQIPGPAAGDGHRRPPLRRRPEGGHVALGHRGVVLVQQGAVHVQTNQSNIVHFFSFRAWRTLSAIPSGVRP